MLKYYIGVPLALIVFGFGYYALSPLFRTIHVNEASPESKSEPTRSNGEAVRDAEVQGTVGHPASGSARIVTDGEKLYLRYENFKTLNGPDLFVYLAKDPTAKEFINLGVIKATEGNVNYEIPAGIDPREYPCALTWCRAFGVLFNSARLF